MTWKIVYLYQIKTIWIKSKLVQLSWITKEVSVIDPLAWFITSRVARRIGVICIKISIWYIYIILSSIFVCVEWYTPTKCGEQRLWAHGKIQWLQIFKILYVTSDGFTLNFFVSCLSSTTSSTNEKHRVL